MVADTFVTFNGTQAGLQSLINAVLQYSWIFEWGMFVFLLVAAGEAAWVFIDSSEKRKADKALVARILAMVGVFMVLPAFIFRFTNTADGSRVGVQLLGEGGAAFNEPIMWNIKWLMAGYGPKIAILSLLGVGMSTLALIIYASTVSRQRPSTEFISALNSQFGDLRQELQSVKSRQAAGPVASPVAAPATAGAYAGGDSRRSAATIIERPSSGAATIIERPGAAGAELRVVSGGQAGRSWRLPTSESKIGRDATNLVSLDDAKASREHAKLRFADGVYTIADLGSSNGTFVNDRQVSGQTPLADGDLVRIGDTVFSFRAGA